MVKRVLDNDRYLGDEEYPQIIDADTFLAARLLKTEKKKDVEHCPEPISSIYENAHLRRSRREIPHTA